MFEQRTLCHRLPYSFNSITANNNKELCVNKRRKIVQDFKRRMLHVELEQYEIIIQHYEYLYKQELATFESETSRINSSYQMCHFNMLMYFVKTYVCHHTKIVIRRIHYK
jgi:hypothetical protein